MDTDYQDAGMFRAFGLLYSLLREGVPVLGYLHWTLLDNFEWAFGYDLRLGLHAVDRQTFARTAKPSAAAYAAFVAAHHP